MINTKGRRSLLEDAGPLLGEPSEGSNQADSSASRRISSTPDAGMATHPRIQGGTWESAPEPGTESERDDDTINTTLMSTGASHAGRREGFLPREDMFSLLAKAQFSVPKEEAGALEASIPAECGAGFRPGPGGRASSVKHAREAVAGGKDYLRWSSSIASTVASEEPSVSPPLHDIEINIDEADEAAASVSMVNIRLQRTPGGAEEYVAPPRMLSLMPGCHLWSSNSSKLVDLPLSMRDFRFLQTDAEDVCSSNPEYLMMSFHEPAELYILTHSILPVPDWLKERFVVDDHTNLHVGWQLGLVRNLTAYLSLNFIRMKNSHMKMWRLKDGIMAKGGKITLPGLGLGRRLSPGFNYVVCWKHSSEQTLTSAGRRMSTRYKSKEEMNEALEEAVVRQDVLKADLLLKEGADVDITLCAAAFRGSLLTKVPAMTRNMPMLCCLVEHGAELDWYSLNYVLEHSHLLPAPHAPLEHFLTKYVRATRNPANTCYAIAHCLSNAAKDIASKASEFNVLSEKFRMAAISLIEDLNKLSYLGGTERWMLRPDEVLEPTKHYSEHFPINLASCSSTALKMHDTEYSSTSTVQNLIQRAWVGVGFIQVARSADPFLAGSPSIINNSYLLTLLTDYGFASQIGRPLLMPLSRVGHVCLFASRAFFDSPRGRWVFKCFCHSIVMYIFHMALFEPKGCDRELVGHGMADRQQRVPPGIAAWLFTASNARVSKVWAMQVLLGLLFLTVLSMGIDIVQMCIFQYGASLSRFLAVESVTNRMDVIQFATLAACATLWLLVESGVFGACEDQLNAIRALKIVFSVSAIVLWIQAMFILRPVNRGLAPLLYVIGQMLSEVAVFMVPLTALLLGFAVALFSLFWGSSSSINELLGWVSVWQVVLLLFRFFVSDFQMSFDIFEPKKYDVEFTPDPVLKIYAILVLIVFTIVASILMANLLIAVLTYKFNPGQIDAESGFQRVMMLEDFQAHVDKRLLPAPFSVVVAASRVLMLPGGTRRKLDRKRFGAFLLPPLDDLGEARHCPTGRKELPYLLFLCTMMPALNTLFGALLVLVLPFCVSHFGLQCSHQAARSAARMIASMRLFSPWPQLSLGQPGISFLTASRGAIFFRSHESSGGRRKSSPSARKLFVALLYTLAMALSLPLMVALGGVLYCLLAAGLWLYSAVYVWLASVLYSCFWLLFGVFTGWLGPSSKVTPEPDSAAEKSSRQSSSAGPSNTSGKNKRWGKLLAKRRKEEFKKVAFKQDDIDTALVLAGLPLQKPSTDEKQNAWKRSSSPSNSPKKAPRDSSDCHLERSVSTPPGCRQMKALKSQKERLGASIAQGKARMLELNTSMARVHQAGHGPGGLAQGIARFDSRHHGHQHPPTQFGALNVSMSRQPTGKRSAAHGGHPSYSGPLMEFSGLMNEMGGVRDDLSQIQEVLQILTSDMLWVKQHVMSGASGHGMARVEGSELSVCVEEEDGTEQAGGGSASDTSAAGDPGPDQGFLQGANGDGRDLDGAPSRPSGTQ